MILGVTTLGYLYRRSIEEALDSIEGAGYRTVEIALAAPHLVPSEVDATRRRELRHALDRRHLSCVSVNPVEMNLISPNPDLRSLALSSYQRSIEVACAVGSEIVVVVPGRQSALIPMPAEAAVDLLLEGLSTLVTDARHNGVCLALETVPFGFIETTAEVAAVVERVGDERVGMALDVANVFGREDVPTAVARAARHLKIAHLSDTWRNRWAHASIGTGEVDFPQFIRALESVGFDGPCIYELADGEDPEPRIGGDLQLLHEWGLE